jgi:hypothetical protein
LFTNGSGRIANPFDCPSQFISGHAKMPRPKFNVVLMLNNDFAAIGMRFTDHVVASLAIPGTGWPWVCSPLTDEQS